MNDEELTKLVSAWATIDHPGSIFQGWKLAIAETQSPAEAAFLANLILAIDVSWGPFSCVVLGKNGQYHGESGCLFQITPQFQIGRYRADFLLTRIETKRHPACSVVIEIDGHQFHEKTAEQASRDRAREREFVRAGYKVIRFTGSDVYHNGFKCAADAYEFVRFQSAAELVH